MSDNRGATVQEAIIAFFNDPFVNILLENSHLTKIQLETVLINQITGINPPSKYSPGDKGKLRLRRGGVSKGSFYRTLSQAKTNIDRSLFTVILLGYLGLLESPSLTPFLELSNKLRTYIEYITVNKAYNTGLNAPNSVNMSLIQKRLVHEVKTLIKT